MEDEEFHHCHFCGEYVKDGKDPKGNRHWLSDCRPDLVEHEIGPTCTWAWRREDLHNKEETTCYAYQKIDKVGEKSWTNEHIHFHKDGPM